MTKIKTEAKIGIIVLITIALVIWGINFLKGKNVLKRSDVFYAVYDDAQGIGLSAPVLINGYQVGLVNKIDFLDESLNKIIISFTVDHKYRIPLNSIAELHSADLLGSKALRILPSGADSFHTFGDTLHSTIEKDMLESLSREITPIREKAENALIQIDSLSSSFNYLLDSETTKHLKQSIAHLNEVTNGLSNQMKEEGNLYKTFESLKDFTSLLSENRSKLDTVFLNLEAISDSIGKSQVKQMLASINRSFSETALLLERINAGEGSLGLLSTNDSLYLNLNSSISSLDTLLQDLNENPGRYVHFSVFGKKDK